MSKQIYMIFYDRGNRAQDNGEHLCRWVMRNHPEIKTGYILNSTSSDWSRLVKEGFNLIDLRNRDNVHKELVSCDYACSSIFNEGINLNFEDCTCKRVFLNHGCFLVPIKYIKDEHANVDLFIAANELEYETFLNSYHQLTPDQVALCGQPRQDSLIDLQNTNHKEDTILIQFWQRPWDWTKNGNKKFLESEFYQKTTALLSNPRLMTLCRSRGLKVVFKMHSIQYDWLKYYRKYENDVIKLSSLSEPFEPLFVKSRLIITDISSNAYEMAKIGKPCIYFEPDPEELFEWRHERNGGFEFDLKNQSIGPIIEKSVNRLVEEIYRLANNNYTLDETYLNRRENQISFQDNSSNCERCFEAIMGIKRSRTAEKSQEKERQRARDQELENEGLPNIHTWIRTKNKLR